MVLLREKLKKLQSYLIMHLSGMFLVACVLFGLSCFVIYMTFRDSEGQLAVFMEQIYHIFPTKNIDTVSTLDFSSIFTNNIKLALMMVLAGSIPFLFIDGFLIVANASMLGVSAAYYHLSGIALRVFLTGMLPHGIFQIPAFLISAALGLRLCKQLSKKILGRNTNWYWQRDLKYMAIVFVCMVLPLLICASLAQAHLTPYILHHFRY